jgi:hypothetical protein
MEFCEKGADTTMVQRSSTLVMSVKNGSPILAGNYREGGPETSLCDTLGASLPMKMIEVFVGGMQEQVAEMDKEILDGLTKAGFKLQKHRAGIVGLYFSRGGGQSFFLQSKMLIFSCRLLP